LETVEIDKILSYSDLFLLPSETESLVLAALEALNPLFQVIRGVYRGKFRVYLVTV
jgi:hypothetical protein